MKKNFKYIVIGVFAVLAIFATLVFSGVFSSGSKTTTTSSKPVIVWGPLPRALISNLMSTNQFTTGGPISYVEMPQETIERDLVEALASGKGPDVIIAPLGVTLSQADKFSPIPYTYISERTYLDSFIDGADIFLSPAGIVALPVFVDPIVMYWNRTIFSNAGLTVPPKNWDEYLILPNKLTVRDAKKNILQSTVAMGGFNNVTNAKEIVSALILQTGDTIMARNENGKLDSTLGRYTGNETESAVKFYMDFSNEAKTTYSWNSALPASQDAFTAGKLATYFGFASEISKINASNPHLDFDVAELPQIRNTNTKRTYGNFLAIVVVKNSTNPARYSVASALAFGAFPEVISKIYPLSSTRRDVLNKVVQDPNKTIFNRSALIARGWLDPNPEATKLIFRNMIDSVAIGRASVSQSIIQAYNSLRAIVGVK